MCAFEHDEQQQGQPEVNRKISDYFSLGAMRNIRHLPGIIAKVENWPRFLLTYLGVLNQAGTFTMRNGARILTGEAVDAVTLMVIFIRQEYGDVPEGSAVIDIGANIGVYSIYAAAMTRDTVIYAYEPMGHNYKILQKNITMNGFGTRIHAFNLGVAEHAGERMLYLGNGSPYHTLYPENEKGSSVSITCTTVKDIFESQRLQRCDLLKLDCEGAEFEILFGMPDEYLHRVQRIRLEYHNLDNGRNNIMELKQYLEAKGFREITPARARSGNWNNAWFERVA